MNGVLKASVSAGSSHLAASVTCRPQRISPSAATAGRPVSVHIARSRASTMLGVRDRAVIMADTLRPGRTKVKGGGPGYAQGQSVKRGGGAWGGGERSGGGGPRKPVRGPKGCDSGEWVTQRERPPPPTTGPTRLALRMFANNPA